MKAYCSLIQYSHEPTRQEAVNVGVCVFAPNQGATRILVAKANSAARRLFGIGGSQLLVVNDQKHRIKARLEVESRHWKSLEDMAATVDVIEGNIRLCNPMQISCEGQSLDELTSSLLSRFVEGKDELDSRATRERRSLSARKSLEAAFRPYEAQMSSAILSNYSVQLTGLRAPIRSTIAVKNGKVDLYVTPSLHTDPEENEKNISRVLMQSFVLSKQRTDHRLFAIYPSIPQDLSEFHAAKQEALTIAKQGEMDVLDESDLGDVVTTTINYLKSHFSD